MRPPDGDPGLPIVSVVGRKNSGKTTLVVAVVAELKRRGYRVATVKHGHHAFEIDQPGRDSWRHFHEGGAEAVLMASAEKIALVMRTREGEEEPERLIQEMFGGRGYDLVVVEGYKRGPFPKIEIFRRAVHESPLLASEGADPEERLAIVTDDPGLELACPVIAIVPGEPAGSHVRATADLIERWLLERRSSDGL